MIIEYKILWVDDQIKEDGMKDLLLRVGNHLKDLGFNPDIKKCEEAQEALKALNKKSKIQYDLILSDFNLGHKDDGGSLIKKIRGNKIYTEILFYSGQNNFEETAKSLYKDRLSFFSLSGDEGYRAFTEKITKLIDLTVGKLQEIDNLRGTIVGAVSVMDSMIADKLKDIFANADEKTNKDIKIYATKKIIKREKYICTIIKDINEDNVDQYLNDPNIFDASTRAMILNKYIKIKKLSDAFNLKGNCKNFHCNYKKNALDVRNKLAHWNKSVTEDNVILDHEGTEERFGTKECIKLRIAINDLFLSIQSINIK